MQNVCFIDKPKGITSFDLCYKMRKVLNTKTIGHTGTLDPNATGVMIILFDKTCKANSFLTTAYKEYVATVDFGYTTDTLDIDGKIISFQDTYNVPSKEEMIALLNSFKGKSLQRPPLTSAIKVKGKKLYEYQRAGQEVEIPLREIEVSEIELLNLNDKKMTFRVKVSSGTYIRTLARDILAKFNIEATLSDLRRTMVDEVKVEDCDSLEDAENGNIHFHPLIDLIKYRYPIIECDEKVEKDVKNGKALKLDAPKSPIALVKDDEVLAIYEYKDGLYYSKRGLF